MEHRTFNVQHRVSHRCEPAHRWMPGIECWVLKGREHRSDLQKERRATSRCAFTLMELLLVLALLAMAVAVAAPSLSRFFRSRALDSEARRMLALTHYGQSRAVSEGVPMVMWFKPDQNLYGLQAEMTYTGTDPKAVEYKLDSHVQVEVDTSMMNDTTPWKITSQIAGATPAIRFTPDGFIAETSPAWIWIKETHEDNTDAVWLVMNDNHLDYELQSFQPIARR